MSDYALGLVSHGRECAQPSLETVADLSGLNPAQESENYAL